MKLTNIKHVKGRYIIVYFYSKHRKSLFWKYNSYLGVGFKVKENEASTQGVWGGKMLSW